ncbi:aldehyde dehydrogenase family protein [Nocardiopsis ansamitocini]|uniref:Aldehyde dehydrogenase n=1 Tax=Nocardiopsis ansamitocini TaxID=1670832 RepID=A0A9W6PA31_9ACTN|nr:aldehyde dehydrogenase family protein [Nocardiopsis ansamitocini]GLU49768.1 aldehyde dehydrogenase [Nocardiopsis ansamitocini]
MTSTFQSVSPQRPDTVVGVFQTATGDDVRKAVRRAADATPDWAGASALDRSRALDRAAAEVDRRTDEIVELTVREVGKPRSEAAGELRRAVDILRFNAQVALQPVGEVHPTDGAQLRLTTLRRPHGVVGLITPWNFPVAIPLWKAAPALALGNSVVVKASPDSAAVTELVMGIVAEQLPAGAVQVVHGYAEAGQALVASADAISFTGSTAVGTAVAAACAQRCVPVQAEMGGLNASLVLPGGDVAAAARKVAYSIAGYAGQKCTATRRVITIGDGTEFVEALAAALDDYRLGDPVDPDVAVGPLIASAARDRVAQNVERAIEHDGAVRYTRRTDTPADGFYHAPALVGRLAPDSPLLRDEVFGPLACVIEAADDDDAVRIANGVDYGLTGAVIGTDLERAQELALRLHVGMAKVNEPTTGASHHVPFGGEGISSFGPREQGLAAVEMYTWKQTLAVSRL